MAQIEDSYNSISAPSRGVYKDLGSKFLAFAYPVESVPEAMETIAAVRKEYFDARHHCYAYRIGYKGDLWRINDDGEPSSSAGRPIYGQLLANSLSDVLVVVVRYFGGTKLGIPGLIKAYKSATADALAAAVIKVKTATTPFSLSFRYEDMNRVMKLIKDFSLSPRSQAFDNICSAEVDVRLRDTELFLAEASKVAAVTSVVP